MLRRRFLDPLVKLQPLGLAHVIPCDANSAKPHSMKAYYDLKKSRNLLKVPTTEIEETVFLSICAQKYDQVWDIAQRIKKEPSGTLLLSSTLYLLLLRLIAMKRDRNQIELAGSLYEELYKSRFALRQEEHDLAASLIVNIYSASNDFTHLLALKILYENCMTGNVSDLSFAIRYVGAHLDILLNCGQYQKALQMFEMAFEDFGPSHNVKEICLQLPVSRMLGAMSEVEDFDNLTKWLDTILENKWIIPLSEWVGYLSLGLSSNHYGLVKLIYTRLIMADLDGLLSTEDVLFSNKVTVLQNRSTVLATLSEATLHQILHTLASNGDVNLTLNLIEWHYIHKTMRGEKALTKELCAEIIASYCCHHEELPEGAIDESIQRVLDVLDGFVAKVDGEFSYKEISDSMSRKFVSFQVHDANIERAKEKETAAIQKLTLEDKSYMPRKITNPNITSSKNGNILKNTAILRHFVTSHINYILEKNYSTETLRIFVNCVLEHINKYQNSSGMISVLLTLHALNDRAAQEWLDAELYNIIVKSLSQSSAGKLTGLELYIYLKLLAQIEPAHYPDFISSSIRGEDYNSLLEFYIFEYLHSSPEVISFQVMSLLHGLNDKGTLVADFLGLYHTQGTVPSVEIVEQFWKENRLTLINPSIVQEQGASNRNYYHEIDMRDSRYLHFILT